MKAMFENIFKVLVLALTNVDERIHSLKLTFTSNSSIFPSIFEK